MAYFDVAVGLICVFILQLPAYWPTVSLLLILQVKCFAELATKKVLLNYNSIDHYRGIWLPILAMEAASKTVASGDTLLCNNVCVSLEKRNGIYCGELSLPLAFCKRRKIHILTSSPYGEEDPNDFMCIRYHTNQDKVFQSKDILCTSFVRNIWAGHAIASSASVSEDQEVVVVKFRLEHFDFLPPKELLDTGKIGAKCTVEFLTKLLPDRYVILQNKTVLPSLPNKQGRPSL